MKKPGRSNISLYKGIKSLENSKLALMDGIKTKEEFLYGL
jgi:hypothetical protein